MRFADASVIALLGCLVLPLARAVEAPEGPVPASPQSPAALATPYPQVTTPAVLSNGPIAEGQAPLPPIPVPAPPVRDMVSAPRAEAELAEAKPPGG